MSWISQASLSKYSALLQGIACKPIRICYPLSKKTDALRRAVAEANDPATELTLNRVCLGLGKTNYLLRCQGDRISQDVLARFDRGMCAGVENSLWGPLFDTA